MALWLAAVLAAIVVGTLGTSDVLVGLLALFGTVLTVLATIHVQSLRRQRQAQTLEPQLKAYRTLWALTRAASPSSERQLSLEERRVLADKLLDWYYEEGQGIFLSNAARRQFTYTRIRLLKDTVPQVEIVIDISRLRSHLKNDIGVYGRDDFDPRNRT